MRISSKKYELTAGAFAFMPRRVPRLRRRRRNLLRLSVSAPGGIFDKMVDEIARARAGGQVLSENDLWAIRAEYGMTRVREMPSEDESA